MRPPVPEFHPLGTSKAQPEPPRTPLRAYQDRPDVCQKTEGEPNVHVGNVGQVIQPVDGVRAAGQDGQSRCEQEDEGPADHLWRGAAHLCVGYSQGMEAELRGGLDGVEGSGWAPDLGIANERSR